MEKEGGYVEGVIDSTEGKLDYSTILPLEHPCVVLDCLRHIPTKYYRYISSSYLSKHFTQFQFQVTRLRLR